MIEGVIASHHYGGQGKFFKIRPSQGHMSDFQGNQTTYIRKIKAILGMIRWGRNNWNNVVVS